VGTPALQGHRRYKDTSATAGWGHAGKGRITMSGKGKIIERDYTPQERVAVAASRPAGSAAAFDNQQRRSRHAGRRYSLGDRTGGVYPNDVAYSSNIPIRVWEYTIGGYQVIKKWLSYRERKLPGRVLTKEEVRYVPEMARRIAAILLLEPSLDANYRRVKEHTYPWKP
jgi:hypothetical protein